MIPFCLIFLIRNYIVVRRRKMIKIKAINDEENGVIELETVCIRIITHEGMWHNVGPTPHIAPLLQQHLITWFSLCLLLYIPHLHHLFFFWLITHNSHTIWSRSKLHVFPFSLVFLFKNNLFLYLINLAFS